MDSPCVETSTRRGRRAGDSRYTHSTVADASETGVTTTRTNHGVLGSFQSPVMYHHHGEKHTTGTTRISELPIHCIHSSCPTPPTPAIHYTSMSLPPPPTNTGHLLLPALGYRVTRRSMLLYCTLVHVIKDSVPGGQDLGRAFASRNILLRSTLALHYSTLRYCTAVHACTQMPDSV